MSVHYRFTSRTKYYLDFNISHRPMIIKQDMGQLLHNNLFCVTLLNVAFIYECQSLLKLCLYSQCLTIVQCEQYQVLPDLSVYLYLHHDNAKIVRYRDRDIER